MVTPEPATSETFALAIDLGGTKIDAALATSTGALLPGSRARRPTGRDVDLEGLRTALHEVVAEALQHLPAGAAVTGIGVGSAGPLDRVGGHIRPVNMVGVHGFALRDEAAEAARAAGVEVPVVLGHDGGCLALAESWIGAAVGARASLSIVVSTGIGGGFVFDGKLLGGESGNAGHIGQTHYGDITLEEVASGPGSVAWARSQGWQGETGIELARAVEAGDPVARAAVERSARAVGQSLADASTLLDLDVIVIGGGFSRVTPDYIDLVGEALREHAVLEFARTARVTCSALGDDGPLLGAAALVLR